MSQPKNLLNEVDVGSGEKTPGQKETDKMIQQVPDKHQESNAPHGALKDNVQEHTDSQAGNPP